MKRILCVLLPALLLCVAATAQTTKRELLQDLGKTGASYYAYPGPRQTALTPAPEGYKPFYISHYGRHGSRYVSDNKYYTRAIAALDSAARLGLLTPRGRDVLAKLCVGYADAFNRDGDLTALGGRQHREIARRMYERFPELLSQPLRIDAKSSTTRRCMISMFNFCGELQALNPWLDISMDASSHDMHYVVGNSDVKLAKGPRQDEFERKLDLLDEKASDSRRLMKVLFTDPAKVSAFVKGSDLAYNLYKVASDLQNVPELNLSLMDLFTRDELFDTWVVGNADWLLGYGLIPGSTPGYLKRKEVMDSIVSYADRFVAGDRPAVSLRFSHDSAVLPLAYMLGLKEAMGATGDLANVYKQVSIDKIIPMGGNIQLVFYKKDGSDDVLVKFLLNENETSVPVRTDCAPYYHWTDVKAYWNGRYSQ